MNQPSRIVPCLWFDSHAEQAARFYTETFARGRIVLTSHYPEAADNPGGMPPGSVLAVAFEIGGQRFTALNGGPVFVKNPSISFFVHVDSAAQADRTFGMLAEGGQVLMPIGGYPWSERYGWVQDRFGVSWQVIAGRQAASGSTIAPCLMFTGPQHGKAEAALSLYTHTFPDSRIEQLERYAAREGPEGTIKHGRCLLSGQTLIAMDSHMSHGFTFNEGISLQVMCKDQAELDRYWRELSAGGELQPCGWLKDRFGLSWQIVPAALDGWLSSPDVAARERALRAIWKMGKLEIAAVQAAFEGCLT